MLFFLLNGMPPLRLLPLYVFVCITWQMGDKRKKPHVFIAAIPSVLLTQWKILVKLFNKYLQCFFRPFVMHAKEMWISLYFLFLVAKQIECAIFTQPVLNKWSWKSQEKSARYSRIHYKIFSVQAFVCNISKSLIFFASGSPEHQQLSKYTYFVCFFFLFSTNFTDDFPSNSVTFGCFLSK